MHTVARMLKRILTLAAGVVLGLALAVVAARVSLAWGLFPNRDLNRSSAYFKEVLQLVNENYVDTDAAAYDKLARSAIHGMVESLDPHSEFLESKDYTNLALGSHKFEVRAVDAATNADPTPAARSFSVVP